jgi:metal transporter CNNM
VRSLPLHKVPFVAQNEPLLGILDKFQEGRSHMAIVTRTSVEKASSVKKAVKKSITQRIKDRVGISDSSSDNSSDEEPVQTSRHKSRKTLRIVEPPNTSEDSTIRMSDRDGTSPSEGTSDKDERGRSFSFRRKRKRNKKQARLDVEMGIVKPQPESEPRPEDGQSPSKRASLVHFALTPGLEQSMPADAVLAEEGAKEVSTIEPWVQKTWQ